MDIQMISIIGAVIADYYRARVSVSLSMQG